MISAAAYKQAQQEALTYLQNAGIVLAPAEADRIEVADFGLGELAQTGLTLITYINTERVCAKELVLFPGQTCPEHRHPPRNGQPGKEETFRCRWGTVYLYVAGEPTVNPSAQPPRHRRQYYTVWHEFKILFGFYFYQNSQEISAMNTLSFRIFNLVFWPPHQQAGGPSGRNI